MVFLSKGDVCPAGNYCPVGSSAPTQCNPGTYMNHTGAALCDDCPERYYCINYDRADICTQGYYCPAQTGHDLQMCAIGTFGATTGLKEQAECTDCSRETLFFIIIWTSTLESLTLFYANNKGGD